jgi:hypothetical protein
LAEVESPNLQKPIEKGSAEEPTEADVKKIENI